MSNPDLALGNLSSIYTEFSDFCLKRGNVSESDTRVKVIDRILREVLFWDEACVRRETNVKKGYVDYILQHAN